MYQTNQVCTSIRLLSDLWLVVQWEKNLSTPVPDNVFQESFSEMGLLILDGELHISINARSCGVFQNTGEPFMLLPRVLSLCKSFPFQLLYYPLGFFLKYSEMYIAIADSRYVAFRATKVEIDISELSLVGLSSSKDLLKRAF